MMTRSTALFDRKARAHRVMQALDDAGLECILIDSRSTDLSDSEQLNAEALNRLGMANGEASRYADRIDRGATLLVITCDNDRIEELFELMARFRLEKTPDSNRPERIRFRNAVDGPVDINTDLDSEKSGPDRQGTEQTPPPETDGDIEQTRRPSSQPEAAGTPGILQRFENSFQRHYEQHYGESRRSFADYARAYHYGVVLAEHGGFRDMPWVDVEPFARQGWDAQTHGRWAHFREAAEYGWRTIRGGQRQRAR